MSARDGYDVLVLGSGIAGLAGALAAHELGLRPAVLEKATKIGGGTVNSYGLIWVGQNHLAQAAGYADSRDETTAYMRFLGAGSLDEERMQSFVDRSPEAVQFFGACGVPFRLVRGVTDHYYGKAPGSHAAGRSLEVDLISGFDLGNWRERVLTPEDVPCFVTAEEQVTWGGINNFSRWDRNVMRERKQRDMRGKGLGLICHFVKALRDRAVPIFTGQKVDRLATEGHRVTGIIMGDGNLIAARRGVILATGAYSANPQMNWEFEQLPGIAQEASSLAPASLTGDGLVLGAEVGGILHKIENSLRVMLSYTIPPDAPGETATCVHAGIVELCSPHTMVVNRTGRRFADETFFQGIVPKLRLFDPARHEYMNLPAYLIFDAQYLRKYSFANRPAGSEVPKTVSRCASLPELAAKLGVDGNSLVNEVERFNRFARTGLDEDFHRGENQWKLAAAQAARGANASLGTIEEPPFHGVELHPTGAASVGLRVNGSGQVIHQRRHPIPRLYASGNVAAATEHGVGYQAGLSLAAAMTFSYLAVRHMIETPRSGLET
jgi:3-oxosteroid 1-dehydrogenase